ncbi:MAG: lamin tail domain-containing protein [Bacteroidota bacterium]
MKKIILVASFIFVLFSSNAQIVITEINYNTPGAVDSLDFIEIYNNSGAPVNLTGWKFKKAISHTIGSLTLNAGQYHVFCYDSIAFERAFGFSANQWRSSALSNSSDSIFLENASGTLMDYVVYKDVAPWPILADGEGPSLALCDASLDNSNGSNWTYGATPTGIIVAGKEIYAHPMAGCPLTDIAPPIPYSANETSTTTVQVYFNEAVNTTATNVANYTGLGTITSAVRNGSNDIVTLTLATPLVIGKYYVLSVDNIEDLAANAMTTPRYFNIVYNNTIGTVAMDELYYDDPFLNDTLEFIELVNYGSSDVAIGGYWFDKGINLRLPEKTLVPNEKYVVAKDSLLIYVGYGIQAKQWSSGGLGNTTESIRLTNSLFQLIDSMYYNTATLTSTNGTGASLVVCPPYSNLNTYNDNLSNWTAEIPRTDNMNLYVVGGRNTIVSPNRTNCEATFIENPLSSIIELYPNVTNDLVHITNNTDNNYELTIYDAIGSKVNSIHVTAGVNVIDITNFTKGIYYFKINNLSHLNQTYKIIKI